nr:hypothetical protein 10 [bacterium]
MATKRSKKSTPPKEVIPPGWVTIKDAVENLKKDHAELSYHGLSYYRRLGIIGEPRRFKGCMDKYYFYPDLLRFVETARSLTTIYDIKLTRLRQYVKKLPQEVYFDLPNILLKTHGKVWGASQETVVPTYSSLHIGMSKVLDNTLKKIDPKKIDELVSRLEKETKKYKKDLTSGKR